MKPSPMATPIPILYRQMFYAVQKLVRLCELPSGNIILNIITQVPVLLTMPEKHLSERHFIILLCSHTDWSILPQQSFQ